MQDFAASYLAAVEKNVPDSDQPLHSMPKEYSETVLMYESIMVKYIELLKKNIE